MVFSDIIVKTDHTGGQIIPTSFQVSKGEPYHDIQSVNPIISYMSKRRTEYHCHLVDDKHVVLILEIANDVEHWSVDMDWDVSKPTKTTTLVGAEVSESLQKKLEKNEEVILDSIVGVIGYGILCSLSHLFGGWAFPDALDRATHSIFTVGLAFFAIALTCALLTRLFYHVSARRLFSDIKQKERN